MEMEMSSIKSNQIIRATPDTYYILETQKRGEKSKTDTENKLIGKGKSGRKEGDGTDMTRQKRSSLFSSLSVFFSLGGSSFCLFVVLVVFGGDGAGAGGSGDEEVEPEILKVTRSEADRLGGTYPGKEWRRGRKEGSRWGSLR